MTFDQINYGLLAHHPEKPRVDQIKSIIENLMRGEIKDGIWMKPNKVTDVELIDALEKGLPYLHIKSRVREVVDVRCIVWALQREMWPQISLQALGQRMGGFNHATVLHSLRKCSDLRGVDTVFSERYDKCREAVTVKMF